MDILFEKPMVVTGGNTDVAAMFDHDPTTGVSNAESITFTLAANKCNSIAFFGLDAFEIQLSLTNNTTGEEVYTETISLLTGYSMSWSEFFYKDPAYLNDVISGTMPFCANGSLTVTISKPGGTAACKLCMIGRRKLIGPMRENPSFGRDLVKRAEFEVKITRDAFDQVHKNLTSIAPADGTEAPAVFICENSIQLEAGLIFGAIEEFDITPIYQKAIITFDIKGYI